MEPFNWKYGYSTGTLFETDYGTNEWWKRQRDPIHRALKDREDAMRESVSRWYENTMRRRKQAARHGCVNESDGTVRCRCTTTPLRPVQRQALSEFEYTKKQEDFHKPLGIYLDGISRELKPGQRFVMRNLIQDEYIAYAVGKFETVADAFNTGKVVRRLGWKGTVSGIVKLPNTRFVTLLLPNGASKQWQPYAEDLAADDWYVV